MLLSCEYDRTPSVLPTMQRTPPAYFARFDPLLRKWLVICRSDESKRAEFQVRDEAEEYARLRCDHDFERQSNRVKTIPPPALASALPE